MSQSYVYSIATDFPNNRICPETLEDSIQTNILSAAYEYMNIVNDACMLFFSSLLSESDATLLLAIVNTHTGNPPPMPPSEVILVGDSDAGIPRVAVQPSAIPSVGVEFCLGVTSEMYPTGSPPVDTSETESDIIPIGKTLHMLFARASCAPKFDSVNVPIYMLVELIWREVFEAETYDHLFGKSYLFVECQADFPSSSVCFDGTSMVGDGATTRFVIRRTVFGAVDIIDTIVAVRGYYI